MNMQTLPIAGDIPTSSELVGKVAIVTGSTSGIGLGVAKALARAVSRAVYEAAGTVDAVMPMLCSTCVDRASLLTFAKPALRAAA